MNVDKLHAADERGNRLSKAFLACREVASCRRRSSSASMLRLSALLRLFGCGGGTVGVVAVISGKPTLIRIVQAAPKADRINI